MSLVATMLVRTCLSCKSMLKDSTQKNLAIELHGSHLLASLTCWTETCYNVCLTDEAGNFSEFKHEIVEKSEKTHQHFAYELEEEDGTEKWSLLHVLTVYLDNSS